MGLFGSLLGNKKSSSDLPPEVEQVFEKLHRFLSDENLQNSKMPSPLSAHNVSRGFTASIIG
jgi:hypothetical protein